MSMMTSSKPKHRRLARLLGEVKDWCCQEEGIGNWAFSKACLASCAVFGVARYPEFMGLDISFSNPSSHDTVEFFFRIVVRDEYSMTSHYSNT